MIPGRHALLRRHLVRLLGSCAVVAAALLLPADEAGATSFSPSWDVALTDSTPGASSSITFTLNIAAPDSQLGAAVSFIPPEFAVSNGDSITNGAITGNVTATATLGLIGGACNSTLNLAFDLMDATTASEYTVYLYDGVYDYNNNGLPDNVDYYPSSLAYLAPDTVPLQRLYGQVLVAGVFVPINFAVFAPGTPIPFHPAFDSSLGYPTVTIIGDPVAVPGPTFPVSDFCTPLVSAVTIRGISGDHPSLPGDQAGQVLRTNPQSAGSYNAILFARGRYDTDNDGIENGLDSCPLTPDPAWDPRSDGPSGDADIDGLPDSCDPNNSDNDLDSDGDGFNNRLDLCPTLSTTYLHYDQDRDGIGDQCDPFPEDATQGDTAHREQVCLSDTLVIGSAGPEPPAWTCPSGPDLPIPPRLLLSPDEGVEAIGLVHSVHARALKAAGAGNAVGVTVDFEITGANPQTGSCLTSNYGDCEFNYLGTNEGQDAIQATATIDTVTVSKTVSNVWVGPPPNDDFASASPVTSLPFTDVQLPLAATTQAGEVQPCGGGDLSNTVWYAFTPSEKVLITAQAETNSTYMMVAAYTGTSLNDLAMVRCGSTGQFSGGNYSAAPPYFYRASISFWAAAGVTYHFQAGSQLGGFYGYPEVQFSIKETALGDADCSGMINAVDALGVLRKSAGLSAPACVGAADVNCSGGLNSVDALLILRAAARIIPKPTICP